MCGSDGKQTRVARLRSGQNEKQVNYDTRVYRGDSGDATTATGAVGRAGERIVEEGAQGAKFWNKPNTWRPGPRGDPDAAGRRNSGNSSGELLPLPHCPRGCKTVQSRQGRLAGLLGITGAPTLGLHSKSTPAFVQNDGGQGSSMPHWQER